MLTPTLLQNLRCPRSKEPLHLLTQEEWTTLSARLASLDVTTAFGATITAEGGAICVGHSLDDVTYFYPHAEGLLYLMPSDAVSLPEA